jgi:hypothetical protein
MQIIYKLTFSDYKKRRLAGEFSDLNKEQALMAMFAEQGLIMNTDGRPRQPAEIITDPKNKCFLLKQGDLDE